MSVYFVAQIKVNDEKEYERYLEKCDEVFAGYNGEYLAADLNPETIEGKWDYDRMILIKFPDKRSFEEWYYSEEYKNILKHRLKGADCITVLADGK